MQVRPLLADRFRHLAFHLGAALRNEGGLLWAGLGDPFLAGLLLLTLFLATLSFQAGPPFSIQVGRQPPDLAYLDGVHAPEPEGAPTFRWSQAETRLHIPGLGQASQRLDLSMAAPRFGQPAPRLRIESAGKTLLDTAVSPEMGVFSVLLPAEALRGGDLDLLLHSDTFTPTGDPRQLGVVLRQIEVRPAGWPVLPAPATLLWVTLTVLLVVLLARRLEWPRPVALAAGAVTMLALAAVLAWNRPLLTPGLPYLPLAVFCAWLTVVLFQRPLRRLFSWGQAGERAERLLWTVGAFFLVVRLAGVLHPAFETWDLCFHYHRLESVMRGQLFFTITSGEWRSQETLYLPSLYLLVAPFEALFGGRLLPLKVAELLLDTSAALLAAYVARQVLRRDAVAPLAALFYLAMRLSFAIFSWGIASNVLGQWLLLAVLALLVSPAGRLAHGRARLGAAGLLLLAVLAHPGTVQLTGLLLALLLATALIAPLRELPRAAAWRWLLVGLVAVALGVALYYSYFAATMWRSLQQMGQGANAEDAPHGGFLVRGPPSGGLAPPPVEVFTPWEALVAAAQELAGEAQAYYYSGPLLLAAMALPGLCLEQRRLAARLLGLAFWIALGFAVVGLAVNLYVRYMYFLLPFVAIGAAWWLERLGRKSWAGRAAGACIGSLLTLASLNFWAQSVLYYGAGCR